MTAEYTTLKVSKKLTDRLKEIGTKSETYEDIIWRLIEGIGNENRVEEKEALERLRVQIETLVSKVKNLESTTPLNKNPQKKGN